MVLDLFDWFPPRTDFRVRSQRAGLHWNCYKFAARGTHALVLRLYFLSWILLHQPVQPWGGYQAQCAAHHDMVVYDLLKQLQLQIPRNWHDVLVFEIGPLYLALNTLNSIYDPALAHARFLRQGIGNNLFFTMKYLRLFYQQNPDWP